MCIRDSSTLCLRIEAWNDAQEPQVVIPGLAAQHCWVRDGIRGATREKRALRRARPRESQRWAASVQQIGPPPAQARYSFVADREADIYETIQRCQEQRWDFLVRANQPRSMVDRDGSVFDAVAQAPALTKFTLLLRSRPKRVTTHKQTGKPKRIRKAHGPRRVELEVRVCTVVLRPPQRTGGADQPRTVHLVEAREVNAAPGDDPIQWVLLTSWPCATEAEAMRVVKAYTRRWLIEEYHKALKTGTGVEDSQLRSEHRIEALLGILAVVALRLLNRKLLAGTHPDEPVDASEVGDATLGLLEAVSARPPGGWTNRDFLRAIAKLGGFIGRKGDGEPGWLTIWRGWQVLLPMLRGFELGLGEECG